VASFSNWVALSESRRRYGEVTSDSGWSYNGISVICDKSSRWREVAGREGGREGGGGAYR
jgi:hypothetical protein